MIGDSGELALGTQKRHSQRWRITRAGILNVWFYYDAEFVFSGGRMILRGTNGSGKSRALEMLLPFLLDADRRKMDATGSGKVRLEDLMRNGAEGQTNRLGYLWLEVTREVETDDGTERQFRTIGALIRFSASTGEAKPWYFTTPLRVGEELRLMDDRRQPLSREKLGELLGPDLITDRAEVHRERVGALVFGLTGQTARERYAGLLQLLHTLRAPDMGNRIDEGNLPKILSDALPPLSEVTLREAGERLDSLKDSRDEQRRLLEAVEQVNGLLDIYRRYTARTLSDSAEHAAKAAAQTVDLEQKSLAAKEWHARLAGEHALAVSTITVKREEQEVLAETIRGIESSDLYRTSIDLHNLANTVDTLRRASGLALGAAQDRRNEEAAAVRRADNQAETAVHEGNSVKPVLEQARDALAAAHLPTGALPTAVTAMTAPGASRAEEVRLDLDSSPELVKRPAHSILQVSPSSLDDVVTTTRDLGDAAERRESQARSRLATAEKLEQKERATRVAEDKAQDAADKAEAAAELAQEAAESRDDQARELAALWRKWTVDDHSTSALGEVDWSRTPVGPLLLDADSLAGAHEHNDDLKLLDAAAVEAASPAREAIAAGRAELRHRQQEDDRTRAQVVAERRDLLAARDPEPPAAPWIGGGPAGALPLWRVVDFADAVPEQQRAGLEAALMAAGLLSAWITPDGSVRAETGQVLLTDSAPAVEGSIRAALRWDEASTLPEPLVTGVLSRIGLGRGAGTWVDGDGRWGAGPLSGRHQVDRARHIGAAARAAARAERLAQIVELLAALDARDAGRGLELEQWGRRENELNQLVRTSPSSNDLLQARLRAGNADREAADSSRAAGRLRQAATTLRTELTSDQRAHAEQCVRIGLPQDRQGLTEIGEAAREAIRSCRDLVRQVNRLQAAIGTHDGLAREVDDAAGKRGAAERIADEAWGEWHREHAGYTAVQEAVGADIADVQRRLQDAKRELGKVRIEVNALNLEERRLSDQTTAAAGLTEQAAQDLSRGAATMRDALNQLERKVAVPGVFQAAAKRIPPTASESATATEAIAFARQVQEAVDRSGAKVDESALVRALQTAASELTNTFDLNYDLVAGIWQVELTDATGRQPVVVAAENLRERADRAGSALTDREHQVFTDFVVGGVGEELRRRLIQADQLVKAMNTSLADIRTSHGIGVRLRWVLTEDADSRIARIRELVQASSAVRSPEETAELIVLLKERVDEQFARDADGGYRAHLSTAADYRQWHRVEVTILGPAPGQERKISRKAKLSQGETRFVSYVALFAAADAYLSGLPDTDLALRLILLDDAFAKVDERTIGELMGLLVRLDLDFCMTGHALWGTYGQVPSVDVYEIRRSEGTAAIATRVHWDGHTRHYLKSTG
ncbi:TIGR02680 family protein [Actinokineospora diospyrosa]|uniref:TIGR02680 family protein n=1 Tax=Actinokineospora diospyrosa TaxID=103728 RepID=A0ABT1IKF2_9PSEU|nr:TIGR02680 family protein [Actinokineospora diospyrosa]MCP2273132.1 TIGR02680 family protein [Actinokineospora diospyrosa]